MVDAYQTLENRNNIEEVEKNGPFKCTRSDAWLGHGYYFWDTEIKWAKKWGKMAYERQGSKYIIGHCIVNIYNYCFDLVGSVKAQNELKEVIAAFRKSGKIKNQNELILQNIIYFMQYKMVFPYRSIRAADHTPEVIKLYFSENPKRPEYMYINQRVQICVIDKNEVLLPPFKIVSF